MVMAEIKKQAVDAKKTVKPVFAFGRKNYILMFVGLGFLVLGYLLMVGGGSDDPNVFSPDLFNFQRLTLAPILLVIGFIVEVFAIMIKPKEKE
jgi:hypothetical protein